MLKKRRELIEKIKSDIIAHFDNEMEIIRRAENLNMTKEEDQEFVEVIVTHQHYKNTIGLIKEIMPGWSMPEIKKGEEPQK